MVYSYITFKIKNVLRKILIITFLCSYSLFAQEYSNKRFFSPDNIEILSSYKVLGLGESSHGVGDFTNAKFELIKNLSIKKPVCVSLELSALSGYLLDNYIKGFLDISVEELPLLINMVFLKTEEFTYCLDTLKKVNTKKQNNISIYGIDHEHPLNTLHKLIWLANYFNNKELVFALTKTNKTLENINYWKLDTQNDIEISNSIRLLISSFPKDLDPILQEALYIGINNINQRINYHFQIQGNPTIRDFQMYSNFMEIYTDNPMKQHVVWAHDGHISKKTLLHKPNLGQYLHEELKHDYFSISFNFYEGEIFIYGEFSKGFYSIQKENNTIEYFLNKQNKTGLFYFNNLKIEEKKLFFRKRKYILYGVSLTAYRSYKIKYPKYFDAVFFLDSIKASTPIANYHRSSVFLVLQNEIQNLKYDSLKIICSIINNLNDFGKTSIGVQVRESTHNQNIVYNKIAYDTLYTFNKKSQVLEFSFTHPSSSKTNQVYISLFVFGKMDISITGLSIIVYLNNGKETNITFPLVKSSNSLLINNFLTTTDFINNNSNFNSLWIH